MTGCTLWAPPRAVAVAEAAGGQALDGVKLHNEYARLCYSLYIYAEKASSAVFTDLHLTVSLRSNDK